MTDDSQTGTLNAQSPPSQATTQSNGAHPEHSGPKGARSRNNRETVTVIIGFIVLSGILAFAVMMFLCSTKPDYPPSSSDSFSLTWAQIKYTLNYASEPSDKIDVPTYLAVLCAIFVPICGYVGFEKPRKLVNADQSSLKALSNVATLSAVTSAVLAWPYTPLMLPRHSMKSGFDGNGFLAMGVVVLAAGMVSILPVIEYKEENKKSIEETANQIERLKAKISDPWLGSQIKLPSRRRRIAPALWLLLSVFASIPGAAVYFGIMWHQGDLHQFPKMWKWNFLVPSVFVYAMSARKMSTDARRSMEEIKNPNRRFATFRNVVSGSLFGCGVIVWILLAIVVATSVHMTTYRFVFFATFFLAPLLWFAPFFAPNRFSSEAKGKTKKFCRKIFYLPVLIVWKTYPLAKNISIIHEVNSLERFKRNLESMWLDATPAQTNPPQTIEGSVFCEVQVQNAPKGCVQRLFRKSRCSPLYYLNMRWRKIS